MERTCDRDGRAHGGVAFGGRGWGRGWAVAHHLFPEASEIFRRGFLGTMGLREGRRGWVDVSSNPVVEKVARKKQHRWESCGRR